MNEFLFRIHIEVIYQNIYKNADGVRGQHILQHNLYVKEVWEGTNTGTRLVIGKNRVVNSISTPYINSFITLP